MSLAKEFNKPAMHSLQYIHILHTQWLIVRYFLNDSSEKGL